MGTTQLPLFPLNTVLFPGGPLPLRVFEPRYLDMVSQCLREESGFGVLLITDGEEAGVADTFNVGTVAEIVDWGQGSDGLLSVSAEGKHRFELVSTGRQPDGLYIGSVRLIEAEPEIPVPDEYQFLVRLLERLLKDLGSHYKSIPKNYGDSTWMGYRLTEILPLPLQTKQSVLEMSDPVARLGLLASYVKEEAG